MYVKRRRGPSKDFEGAEAFGGKKKKKLA